MERADAATKDEAWAKLHALVADIKTAMMVTRDGPHLRSRPMRGEADKGARAFWFFTKASAHKADEIEAMHQVCLAYSRPDKEEYVSISGPATIHRDRKKIDELWNPFVAAWFPGGKDDPDLALIKVAAEQAEYWDSTANRLVQLFEVAKANVTGAEPNLGENVKL